MLFRLPIMSMLYMDKVLFQMTQFQNGLRNLSMEISTLKMIFALGNIMFKDGLFLKKKKLLLKIHIK